MAVKGQPKVAQLANSPGVNLDDADVLGRHDL
jgi:hypothetical protein